MEGIQNNVVQYEPVHIVIVKLARLFALYTTMHCYRDEMTTTLRT